MVFKEGIYNMTEAEYRPLPFLNASSIPYLLQSARHYLSMLETPRTQTKAMAFGSCFHEFCLEPDKFKENYVVKDLDMRTSKAKTEMLVLQASNKKVIGEDDFYKIKRMASNIKKHSVASKILIDGFAEQVMLFNLEASNGNKVNCKSKVDYLRDGMVIDLKTTQKSDVNSFSKSIEGFGYYLQAVLYSLGYEKLRGTRPDFIFIAVESESPYEVSVIKLSEEHYSIGYNHLFKAIDVFEKATRTNEFPGYPEVVYDSKISKWFK